MRFGCVLAAIAGTSHDFVFVFASVRASTQMNINTLVFFSLLQKPPVVAGAERGIAYARANANVVNEIVWRLRLQYIFVVERYAPDSPCVCVCVCVNGLHSPAHSAGDAEFA